MSISRPDSPTTTTTTTHHPPPRIEDVVLEAPKLRRTQSVVTPSYLTSFIRWVQLKKYQYEVTFSLYMLTPAEKAIFNFIVLSLFLLFMTAATFYLPNHVSIISARLWYYVNGEYPHPPHLSSSALSPSTLSSLSNAAAGTYGQTGAAVTARDMLSTAATTGIEGILNLSSAVSSQGAMSTRSVISSGMTIATAANEL